MVRSMLSGVSGLRAHQTRMDTIGNNIANVNTYGFKSGRTTFRDIYYQKMSSASEPTAASGWFFQPETVLLTPGESTTVRLVHLGEDGLPSGATPPATLDVRSSHPDIASLEDPPIAEG